MSKITRNKFLWFTVAIVCIVTIYYYQKSKAAEDYQKMLEVSAKSCDLDTLKLLIKKSRGDSSVNKRALYDAAEEGCLEVVKFLLDQRVDIDASLALLSAADSGQLEVVKLLLERGADPHVRGWKGHTPRARAFKRSFYNSGKPYGEIIDLLDEAEKHYKPEQ